MDENLLTEEVRRVYQRDLWGTFYSFNTRVESGELEHGDLVRIRVERVDESYNRGTDEGDGKDLDG